MTALLRLVHTRTTRFTPLGRSLKPFAPGYNPVLQALKPKLSALFHTSRIMASDDDYAAFLDKANQDTGSAQAQSSSKWASTRTKDTEIPKILSGTEVYYQSETDELFEPVALKYDQEELPGVDDFKQLIGFKGEVEQLKEKDFDPRGTYKEIVDLVKKAGNDGIAVFRAEHGVSRAQYYVVSVDKKGKKLVGMVAAAVET